MPLAMENQTERHSERIVRWVIVLAFLAASSALWWPAPAHAAVRIKEVAAVQGVRNNPLLGYGLVVGLDGTGDQATQSPFNCGGMPGSCLS